MDIILIGSGNTATVIGRKSLAAGHRIVQVYSRNGSHANQLANRLGATSTSYISTVEKGADLMIIALQDGALPGFTKALGTIHCPAVHTAGALSITEISGLSQSYGVLYPLQSLRREIEVIPPLTILVDGNNPASRNLIKVFASTIAESVLEADDDTRLKYHLAATLVNNFTNHLFAIAASFCEKEKISFAVLQPLMEETVLRLRTVSPFNTQTGPAFRNDLTTIQKHKEILKNYPDMLSLYEKFTEEIQKFASGVKL
jgi:hypothetical protein